MKEERRRKGRRERVVPHPKQESACTTASHC